MHELLTYSLIVDMKWTCMIFSYNLLSLSMAPTISKSAVTHSPSVLDGVQKVSNIVQGSHTVSIRVSLQETLKFRAKFKGTMPISHYDCSMHNLSNNTYALK